VPRYELTLDQSVVTNLVELDDDDEEMLGIEWALSEIKETFTHSGTVSASFTLANEAEVDEILDFLDGYFGDDHDAGVEPWRNFREKR
jgi:hypothetical protein